MRHLVLAQARAHRGRYVASALAVVVAVAFVVATLVLGSTVDSAITTSTAAQYDGAAAVITESDSDLDPDGVLTAISAVPGVEASALDVTGPIKVAGTDGYSTASTVSGDVSLRWQRLADGRWPSGPGEVTVGSSSRHAIGDSLAITDIDGKPAAGDVTVVGTVDLAGSPLALDSRLVFGDVAQVRAWAGEYTEWEIRVAGRGGSALTDALAAAVPGAQVTTGADRATAVAGSYVGDIGVLRNVLLCFAAIAVVVAGLVISNTFAVLLAARTREFALMRCVGVTSAQVRRSVRAESVIVGFVSAVFGVLAGCGLAAAVVAVARAADVPIPLTSIAVTPGAIGLGLLLGTVVTVIAANGPARAATRVSALAAMHPLETQPEPVRDTWVRRVCALLAIAGGAALLGIGAAVGNVLMACPGGLMLFVGVILASRRIVPALVGAVGQALARFGGPVAALAAGNARRNPRRTASTATALFIGVTLTSTIVVGIGTLKAGAPALIDENFPVDVAVMSVPDASDGAVDRFTALDGLRAGTAVANTTVGVGETEFFVTGVDPDSAAQTLRDDVRLPQPGTIALEPALAETLGVREGEAITVRGDTGSRELTVVTAGPGAPDLIALADLQAIDSETADTVWLRLDDGLTDDRLVAVSDDIARVAADISPGSEVVGAVANRQMLEKVLDTMLLVVGGLLSIAILIALIGVGNTMALSVIERRRETGMLRALGLSRSGVRSLLVREGVIIAGVASVLGVALGLLLGTAGTASVIGAGYVTPGAVPWAQLVAIVVAGSVAGVVASLIPAYRAGRTSPVAALTG
ncbi:ABC transporter permease [Rhodococcus sp. (in: high G+C Gram-positive bacteria)]|uniref:FtsX-like permease family protein n=1 Tax=Rhodococcus sp. TaxID=1831 RepID=UPI001A061B7A|nr:ABC transporter permease [Rhodococcus sp. (in: high G+C Gram-positive bacteria)]MBF0661891.1 ABC transporter permease [Rhodococcus sp. (in: high G+C Gram-positive bacteria)]